jgi:hypothetical protein
LGYVEVESVRWFLRTVLMVLLTVIGVEANLGSSTEQDKTDQKIKQMKNHEKGSKAI